jgi:hypothetical protein
MAKESGLVQISWSDNDKERDHQLKLLKKVEKFLRKYYGKEYVDPHQVWVQQLIDSENQRYAYPLSLVAAFKSGEVKAVAAENVLNPRYQGERYSIGLSAYSAPEEKIAKEGSNIERAIAEVEGLSSQIAQQKGRELIARVVEAEPGKEKLYAEIGYRVLEDIFYEELCQEFGRKSGKPKDDNERLTPMLKVLRETDGLNNEVISSKLLRAIGRKIILDFYCPYQDDKHGGPQYTDKAYAGIEKFFQEGYDRFDISIGNRKEVKLIDPK